MISATFEYCGARKVSLSTVAVKNVEAWQRPDGLPDFYILNAHRAWLTAIGTAYPNTGIPKRQPLCITCRSCVDVVLSASWHNWDWMGDVRISLRPNDMPIKADSPIAVLQIHRNSSWHSRHELSIHIQVPIDHYGRYAMSNVLLPRMHLQTVELSLVISSLPLKLLLLPLEIPLLLPKFALLLSILPLLTMSIAAVSMLNVWNMKAWRLKHIIIELMLHPCKRKVHLPHAILH